MVNFAKLSTNPTMKEEIQSTSHNINPKRFCHLDSQVTRSFLFAFFPDSYMKFLEIIRIELHLSSILTRIAHIELEKNFKWAQFQVGLLSFWPITLTITFSMKSAKV